MINAAIGLAFLGAIFGLLEVFDIKAPLWLQVTLAVGVSGAWLKFGENPLFVFTLRKNRRSDGESRRPRISEVLSELELGGWGMILLSALFLFSLPSIIEQEVYGAILFVLSPLVLTMLYLSGAYHEAREKIRAKAKEVSCNLASPDHPATLPDSNSDLRPIRVEKSDRLDGRKRVEVHRANGSIESFKVMEMNPHVPLPVPAGKQLLKERITHDGSLERVVKDIETGEISRFRMKCPEGYNP